MSDSDSKGRDSGGGFAYCSDCGNELDPGDSYCSDCGAEVGSETDNQSPGEATAHSDLRGFRQRVSDYLARGWEIQYDGGDEVVLVDRGIGSIPVHALLLLFTGGFGNLLYGWYSYSLQAERIVLRAGEDTRPLDVRGESPVTDFDWEEQQADLGPLSHYVMGLLLLLSGIYVIGTSLASFGAILGGIGLVLVSLLVLPPVRRRIRDRHPPTTFGPTESVEERTVSETDQLCSICRGSIDDGVVREYETEFVLAGLPLYTMEAGENWYCNSCHRTTNSFTVGSERVDEFPEKDVTNEHGRTSGDETRTALEDELE
jgi:hypothetical protein